MFKQEKCVPCQGGVPPLTAKEISKYQKLISAEWSVDNSIKLLKDVIKSSIFVFVPGYSHALLKVTI